MYGKHLKIFATLLSSEHMFEIRMPKKNNSFHTHKIETANEFLSAFELHSLQFVLHDGQYEFEFMHLRVSKIFSFYHKINISSLTHIDRGREKKECVLIRTANIQVSGSNCKQIVDRFISINFFLPNR